MARQLMSEEEKKAFGAKMKAAREAKKGQSLNPHQDNSKDDQSEPNTASVDPQIAAKLSELDEAIKKTNELNAQMEAKLAQSPQGDFNSGRPTTPEEIQAVDKTFKSKRMIMKEKLAEQPKVRIFIPLDGKETPGTQHPVTINGYRVNIPKGVYCEVPQQVADIIMESLNQTEAATSRNPKRIDLDSPKADILTK